MVFTRRQEKIIFYHAILSHRLRVKIQFLLRKIPDFYAACLWSLVSCRSPRNSCKFGHVTSFEKFAQRSVARIVEILSFSSSFFPPHEYFPDSLHAFLGTHELVFFPNGLRYFVCLLFRFGWPGGRKQHNRWEGIGTFFRNNFSSSFIGLCLLCDMIWYAKVNQEYYRRKTSIRSKKWRSFPIFSRQRCGDAKSMLICLRGQFWWPHSNGIRLSVRLIDWLNASLQRQMLDRLFDWLIDWLAGTITCSWMNISWGVPAWKSWM